MLKRCRVILSLMVCLLAMCSCNGTESENLPMTVSQEIAAGISENIIPAEAMEYSLLSYPVPEGFVAANDNTDMDAFYISETQQDFSYIKYNRLPNDHLVDYMAMTAEDYKNLFVLGLETEIGLEGCTQEEKDGWQQVGLILTYEKDGISYKTWQYYYITDKFIFSIAYVQAGDAAWENAFLEAAAQTVPKSIVESTAGN
ncbi:MAG: hypothetical protein K2K20_11780 [Lachnospiraceae bacterium]|nr:hypothetical protein [Lachnospiraceae bacterium]